MLSPPRPDPARRGRLEEIRDNLIARVAEPEHEGWPGEVAGLRVSLVDATIRSVRQARQHPGGQTSGLRIEEVSELTTLDVLKRQLADGQIYYLLQVKPSKYDRVRVIPLV